MTDRAQAHPVANEADYLLLLHDDASLDPEGVARMSEVHLWCVAATPARVLPAF